jgi:hypothetical protein
MDAYGQGYFHPNMYPVAQGHHSRPSIISHQPRSQSHSSTPKGHEDRDWENPKRLTIVDGSTHMRSGTTQGSSAGKLCKTYYRLLS